VKTEVLTPDRSEAPKYTEEEIMQKIEESHKWLAGEIELPELPTYVTKHLAKQEDVHQYVMALLSNAPNAPDTRVPIAYVAYIWHKDYRPSPIVEMYLEGDGPRSVMLDSGAGMSLVSRDWFENACANWTDQEHYARYYGPAWGMGGINGPPLPTKGKYKMVFSMNGESFPIDIVISDDPEEMKRHKIDAILGMNFMNRHEVVLDFKRKTLEVGNQVIPYQTDQYLASLNQMIQTKQTAEIQTPLPEPDILESVQDFFFKNPVEMQPNTCSWYMAYTNVCPDKTRVIPSQILTPGIVLMKTRWEEGQSRVWIGIRNDMNTRCNFSKETPLTLLHRTLTEEEQMESSIIGAMIQEPQKDRGSPEYQKEWKETRDAVVKKAEIISEEGRQRLSKLFDKYSGVMRLKHEPPGEVTSYEVEVKLTNYEPINIRPYAMSDIIHTEIDRQLGVMLKHYIIRPSVSEWSFPIVAVKKKLLDLQTDQVQEIRMCIDYRGLNGATEPMSGICQSRKLIEDI
jgi:hypothetical protein